MRFLCRHDRAGITLERRHLTAVDDAPDGEDDHGRQHAEDHDHDQQLDEGESPIIMSRLLMSVHTFTSTPSAGFFTSSLHS